MTRNRETKEWLRRSGPRKALRPSTVTAIGVFADIPEIRHHADRVAQKGRERSAVDVDLRDVDQDPVQRHLADHAGDQRIHRDPVLPDALQDAAGGLHLGEQHDGQGGEGQELSP